MSNVFITGTSSGLGYLTALELARLGARVFATMRNPRRKPPTGRNRRRRGASALAAHPRRRRLCSVQRAVGPNLAGPSELTRGQHAGGRVGVFAALSDGRRLLAGRVVDRTPTGTCAVSPGPRTDSLPSRTITNLPWTTWIVFASSQCRCGGSDQPAGGWSTNMQNAPPVCAPPRWISVRTRRRHPEDSRIIRGHLSLGQSSRATMLGGAEATVTDLARVAGVSTSTASLHLAGLARLASQRLVAG